MSTKINASIRTAVQAEQGTVQLYPLNLSDGLPHGKTARMSLEHSYGENPGGILYLLQWNHTLKICENLLCVHHEYSSEDKALDTLVIWDWQNGEIIMVRAVKGSLQPTCLLVFPHSRR